MEFQGLGKQCGHVPVLFAEKDVSPVLVNKVGHCKWNLAEVCRGYIKIDPGCPGMGGKQEAEQKCCRDCLKNFHVVHSCFGNKVTWILIKFSGFETKSYLHGILFELIRKRGQGAGLSDGLENFLIKIDV